MWKIYVLCALVVSGLVAYSYAPVDPGDWKGRIARLEPLVREAVENEYGPVTLRAQPARDLPDFVDANDRPPIVLGNTLMLTQCSAVTDRACYKTICRYMVGSVLGEKKLFPPALKNDVVQLQVSTYQALFEVYAEDLTAQHFKTRSYYDFTGVTPCEIQTNIFLEMVKTRRDLARAIIEDDQQAAEFLQDCRKNHAYALWDAAPGSTQ